MPNPTAPWLPDIASGTGPLYLRLADALADARADGTLQPGDRLPPQRDIARHLGVDLTTVTRAFTEARRRHLIDATAGRGTFVTAVEPDAPILDLGMNIPPAPDGLSLPLLIRDGLDALLKRSSAEALLSYHPGAGSPAERAAGSLWLARSSNRPPTDRVVVGSGAQSLLAAVVLASTRDSDVVLADSVTYPGFIALATSLNRTLVSVESDADGMLPDRLEEIARRHEARLVYLNPTLHNPTTRIVPEKRRRDLAEIARRNGLTIVEDDPYSALLANPPASFLALAPDITIHIATLAKCISPFLRTAFLVAPSADAGERIIGMLRGMTLMAPPLMTGLAAEWIRSGQAGEIVTAIRGETQARTALARQILPAGLQCHREGFHAWISVDEPSRIADLARDRGLAVSPGGEFSVGGADPQAIRIALGAASNRDRLAEGLKTLATVLALPSLARPAIT